MLDSPDMPKAQQGQTKPSEVDEQVGFFDRFAERASLFVSRAPFFAACLIFVVLWLLQGIIKMVTEGATAFASTTYQLEINTTTTIVTFLMVAILQNSQTRGDAAMQKKMNAIAEAQANLLEHIANQSDTDDCRNLLADAKELRAAVGLEHREST